MQKYGDAFSKASSIDRSSYVFLWDLIAPHPTKGSDVETKFGNI